MSAAMFPANTKPFKISKKLDREFKRLMAAKRREIHSWNLTGDQLGEVVQRELREWQDRFDDWAEAELLKL